MRHDRMEFYAENKHWYDKVQLYARAKDGPKWVQAREVVYGEVEGDYPEPFMSLDAGAVQSLMDELWKCGFRPADGMGSAGQLKATQDHLEDMRSIAFQALGVT